MDQAEPIMAAGVIAKALTTGGILMVERTDKGEWAFPGGRIEDGEDAAQAAYREFGKRLKMDKAHDVPLSDHSLDILRRQHDERGNNPHVFPGRADARPLEYGARNADEAIED